jgi:glycosyltransferase involved in cell wall biosynthesis
VKLAYVCSRYPAISKTFILREIGALRALGLDVQPFSVRRAPPAQLLTEAERAEARRTFAILPIGPLRLLAAHLALVVADPRLYARVLGEALRQRPPGLRAWLWALFYFAEAGVLAHELIRRRIDHVHAHFANVGGSVAQRAAALARCSWSLTLHGHGDFSRPTELGLADKIRAARFVVCVSAFGRSQALLHSEPAHWSKVHVVHCGVDTRRFPAPALLPATPPASGGPLRLLSVGRLSPEKGQRFLVEAVALLGQRGVDVSCRLVGDGPERAALEQLSRALGVSDRVRLEGAVGQDRIQDFYEQADLFVMSSLSEGLPVALMEAMAKQLPVVAPRITGIPELVESGVHGLLFAPASSEALAEAIAALAGDVERRRRMGVAGRARVLREFDVSATVRPLYELFMAEAGARPVVSLLPGAPRAMGPVAAARSAASLRP